MLLNERQNGERFWNLLHMLCLVEDVEDDDFAQAERFIFGVQTVLEDAYMPESMRIAVENFDRNKQFIADTEGFLTQLEIIREELKREHEIRTPIAEVREIAAGNLLS